MICDLSTKRLLVVIAACSWLIDCNGDDGPARVPDDMDALTDSNATDLSEDVAADASNGEDIHKAWDCVIEGDERPDFAPQIGCWHDFELVAADPLDASIPGARSAKTVIDRFDDLTLYFQDSAKYLIHWNFAYEHLSGNGKPVIPPLSQFNQTEYYSPSRRFLLGAVTFYEEPEVWVYEIAPYDTSTADMIAEAYTIIADNVYFGHELYFHPTSEAVAREAEKLPDSVKVIPTAKLFEGITYQPLNLGTSLGRLRFVAASELDGLILDFREIVVLDAVPNDIGVVSGIITATFQTPLSHINVLSQNRGTPNMALIGAMADAELRALEDKWIDLTVGAFDYSVKEVTKEAADQWWEDNKPTVVSVPELDTSVTELVDMEGMLDLDNMSLGDALAQRIFAFGGKASHYGAFPHMEGVPHPKAFAIPVYYYVQFMEQNGFDAWVAEMLADTTFQSDPVVRDQKLGELRDAMVVAEVDPLRALEAAMDGFKVMSVKQAARHADLFVTVTGCCDVLRREHFEKMKDGAFVANAGHFNVEINIDDLSELAEDIVRGVTDGVDEFVLENGKSIYLLGEGRLINLAAANGHPACVMDMSFAVQALTAEHAAKNRGRLEHRVQAVPDKVDRWVAEMKLKAMGIRVDKLTERQKKYLVSWQEGT